MFFVPEDNEKMTFICCEDLFSELLLCFCILIHYLGSRIHALGATLVKPHVGRHMNSESWMKPYVRLHIHSESQVKPYARRHIHSESQVKPHAGRHIHFKSELMLYVEHHVYSKTFRSLMLDLNSSKIESG